MRLLFQKHPDNPLVHHAFVRSEYQLTPTRMVAAVATIKLEGDRYRVDSSHNWVRTDIDPFPSLMAAWAYIESELFAALSQAERK